MPKETSPINPAELEAPIEVAPKERKPIEVSDSEVDVAGIKIHRSREITERVPKAEKFQDFSEDEFSVGLLKKIARAVELDHPLLLQGEVAIGKSYTIEYLAHLCGREVYRMSLNGQTDTTDLIGKWVPRTETVRNKIADLLKNPDKCKNLDIQRMIQERIMIKPARGEEIAPEKDRQGKIGFSKEEMETIAMREGIEVPEGDWIWQDGDIPQQMKKGAWSVLDEVNTCESQILVRLNAVLEKNGELVLSENGSKVVPRHKDFRLFATVNPPGGRYKGRIPLSAEWISRWFFQNLGILPKEVAMQRLIQAEGVKIKDIDTNQLRMSNPERISPETRLTDIYSEEWVKDLFIKYVEFRYKLQDMLANNDLANNEYQKFDFDQRDDRRFRDFIRSFYENDNTNQIIQEAIAYLFIDKFSNELDRQKVRDLAQAINVAEPKGKKEVAPLTPFEKEDIGEDEKTAKAEIAKLKEKIKDLDLPEAHKKLLAESSSPELPPDLSSVFTAFQAKLDARAKEMAVPAIRLEAPKVSEFLAKEYIKVQEAMAKVFGAGNLESVFLPSPDDLTPTTFGTLYPKAQRPEDTAKGLTLFQSDWFEQSAKDTTGADETWFEAYQRAMIATTQKHQGKPLWVESRNTSDSVSDPMLPLIKEVFGVDRENRANLSWDDITTQLIPLAEAKLRQSLVSSGISETEASKFRVTLCPVLAFNLQTTLNHPENSTRSNFEWAEDTLLKADGSDSGNCLLIGVSSRGGAGFVDDDRRGDHGLGRVFRLAVMHEKS